MIDKIINLLFKWDRLRDAIISEVHFYDYVDAVLNSPESKETGSLCWAEADGWRAWSYNKDRGRYYFNDIPEDSAMAAFFNTSENEGWI